ncbi:MAG: hypothetical protein RI907_3607 [Pseudomonadota bacterium]|jgi:hypothetical protein
MSMTRVQRWLRLVPHQADERKASEAVPAAQIRDVPAWVLLAEPGAGKSDLFEQEAKAVGGVYAKAAEVAHGLTQAPAPGQVLFIDALDEARAGRGDNSLVLLLRKQLMLWGRPRFRLSCRAADWLGNVDAAQLAPASPDGVLPVYALVDLTDQDIEAIVGDPVRARALLQGASQAGYADMLRNPLILEMLLEASAEPQQAGLRDLYRRHAEMLAGEHNEHHQAMTTDAPLRPAIVRAAAQLFATLLLSDQDGVSRKSAMAGPRFPSLSDLDLDDPKAAVAAVQSGLFKPATHAGQMQPVHRTMAEELAAQWLAERIDQRPLSAPRILKLLQGADGRPVSGLRGLYARLATHSVQCGHKLIAADPVTVATYGDIASMSTASRRVLVQAILGQASVLSEALRSPWQSMAWGVMWSESWTDLADQVLQDAGVSEYAQQQAMLVLQVLEEAKLDDSSRWAAAAWRIARDPKHWTSVRTQALATALALQADRAAASQALQDIQSGRWVDIDDEMLGVLLQDMYPAALRLDEVMTHLHPPKQGNLYGAYRSFWIKGLVAQTPAPQLPALMAALAEHQQVLAQGWGELDVTKLMYRALSKALDICGDQVDDDQLFNWMKLRTFASAGDWMPQREGLNQVTAWFAARPDRYKAVLQRVLRTSAAFDNVHEALHHFNPLLAQLPVPDDLGHWYLAQVDETDNADLRTHCFWEAMSCWQRGLGAQGLDLDALVSWAHASPAHQQLWDSWRVVEVPAWRLAEQRRQAQRASQAEQAKAQRTQSVLPLLGAIRSGQASPNAMHHLAMIWKGQFHDVPGDSPQARIRAYADLDDALWDAAQAGFVACLHRPDLPSVAALIELSANNQVHPLTLPCLVGIELCTGRDPGFADDWPDDAVVRLLTMVILDVPEPQTDAWYQRMVSRRTEQVAEALVACVNASWRSAHAWPPRLHDVTGQDGDRQVATLALPHLLDGFPLRANAANLRHLQQMLMAAARHVPDELRQLCVKRLAFKSLDASQRLHWMTAAALLDPVQHDQRLLQALGRSQTRAQTVAQLLTEWPFNGLSRDAWDPAVLGRLIELLAPHAEMRWGRGGGLVSSAMALGDRLRVLIRQLALAGTTEAIAELGRLSVRPELHALRHLLQAASTEAQVARRERAFRFPNVAEVGHVLRNEPPVGAADLFALACAAVDQLAVDLLEDNANLRRRFWIDTVINKVQVKKHLLENDCRDVILNQLRHGLAPYQVDVQPEAKHVDDKRADLRLSCGSAFELPVEIKGQWHQDVWTAMTTQLDRFYTSARSDGHGLYLVLWTGEGDIKPSPDRLPRPASPQELEERLVALLTPEQRQRIGVRVLDISLP